MPAGGTMAPKQPSTALLEAVWCIQGQMPQMRLTMRGTSSAGRPSMNFSKPRRAMMFSRLSATLPSSSSWMAMRACPSMRVMGWMLMTRFSERPPWAKALVASWSQWFWVPWLLIPLLGPGTWRARRPPHRLAARSLAAGRGPPENRSSEGGRSRELKSMPLLARALSISSSWLPSCCTGPKQPRQGTRAMRQRGASPWAPEQPARVTGPMHSKPCSSRQCISPKGRARLVVGVFGEAAHLLHLALALPDGGAGVADALGGQTGARPSSRATMASAIWSGCGGQPGRWRSTLIFSSRA